MKTYSPFESVARAALGADPEHLKLIAKLISYMGSTEKSQVAVTGVSELVAKLALPSSASPVTQATKSIFSTSVVKTYLITPGINPHEVLKSTEETETTHHLHVDGGLAEVFALVGSKTAPPQVTVTGRKLAEVALVGNIKKALPKSSNLPPVEFVHLLATELQKVMNRQLSGLLSKQWSTIFFTVGFVVDVGWDDADWRWCVSLLGQTDTSRLGRVCMVVSHD